MEFRILGPLEDLRLAAVEKPIDPDVSLGRDGDMVGDLDDLVAEHPLREGLCEHLARTGPREHADPAERCRDQLDGAAVRHRRHRSALSVDRSTST